MTTGQLEPISDNTCLACGADWDGGLIPEDIRGYYWMQYHWSRRIWIYDTRKGLKL